jgi:hypothetical protein
MTQEQWDELYPEGFRTTWSTRHMPNIYYRDMKRLMAELDVSMELVHADALGRGLRELIADVFSRG